MIVIPCTELHTYTLGQAKRPEVGTVSGKVQTIYNKENAFKYFSRGTWKFRGVCDAMRYDAMCVSHSHSYSHSRSHHISIAIIDRLR